MRNGLQLLLYLLYSTHTADDLHVFMSAVLRPLLQNQNLGNLN